MNAWNRIASVAVVLTLAIGAWGQSSGRGTGGYGGGGYDAGPTEAPMPDGSNASCLLKVSYDARVLPLSPETIQALLRSSGVAHAACKEVLGGEIDSFDWDVTFAVTSMQIAGNVTAEVPVPAAGGMVGMMMGGGGMGMGGGGGVDVHAGAAPTTNVIFGQLVVSNVSDAPAVLAKICENFRKALTAAHEESMTHLKNQSELAAREVAHARQRLVVLQDQRKVMMPESGGDPGLSRDMLVRRIHDLRNEEQGIEMELAAMEARREAVEVQIVKIGAEAESFKYDEHPEVLPIKAQVRRMEQRAERLKKMMEKGAVSVEEYEELEAEGMALTAEGERTKSRLQREMFTDRIVELQGMLAESSMQGIELRSKHEFIAKRLAQLRDALDGADTYELNVAIELPIARAIYESTLVQANAMERGIRSIQPPMVVTIGQQ